MYAYTYTQGFPGDSAVKNSPANARRCRFDSWVGKIRSPGEGNGNPF